MLILLLRLPVLPTPARVRVRMCKANPTPPGTRMLMKMRMRTLMVRPQSDPARPQQDQSDQSDSKKSWKTSWHAAKFCWTEHVDRSVHNRTAVWTLTRELVMRAAWLVVRSAEQVSWLQMVVRVVVDGCSGGQQSVKLRATGAAVHNHNTELPWNSECCQQTVVLQATLQSHHVANNITVLPLGEGKKKLRNLLSRDSLGSCQRKGMLHQRGTSTISQNSHSTSCPSSKRCQSNKFNANFDQHAG